MEDKVKYAYLINKVSEFKQTQKEQIKKGKNDYNILNSVRNEYEEVGMHSNVIRSLLDIQGSHYQGKLFLKLFIKYVLHMDVNGFGSELTFKAEDKIDYNNNTRFIDFTIKSEKFHIGIEMKVNAKDLENQIYDYDKGLNEKARQGEKVIIFYLTKFGTNAKEKSHNGITYNCISFEKEIMHWIKASEKEVQYIPNLKFSLASYKEIVEKITNSYEPKIVQLSTYLYDDEELFKSALEIHHIIENKNKVKIDEDILSDTLRAYEVVRKEIIDDFFETELVTYLKSKLDNNYITHERTTKEYKYKITIKYNENTIEFFGTRDNGTDKYRFNQGDFVWSKYRYRLGHHSVLDFHLNKGEEAKNYYLDIINSLLCTDF